MQCKLAFCSTYLSTWRSLWSFDETGRKYTCVYAADASHRSTSNVTFLSLHALCNPVIIDILISTFVIRLASFLPRDVMLASTWLVVSIFLSKLKDFSRSQAVNCTVNMIISRLISNNKELFTYLLLYRKRCKIETLSL